MILDLMVSFNDELGTIMTISISGEHMSKRSDLPDLKPVRSSCNFDYDFETQIALSEEKIGRHWSNCPIKVNFHNDEEFGEDFGFWIGRQGKVISINLSEALRKWEELNNSQGDLGG